jgi:Na+-driven multidrug efflux pump
MLCESISIATQSLLARFSSDKSVDGKSLSSFIIRRAFLLGGVLSISLSLLIFLFRHPLIASFAKNQEIQTAAIESIPFFLLTQCKFASFDRLLGS